MITIQHIKTEAFNHFISGETILKVSEFVRKIQEKFDLSQFNDAQRDNLINEALGSLSNICSNVGSGCFVLVKPIDTYSQNVEISGDLAVMIASIINTALQKLRNDNSLILTDSLNIKEEDIHSLALMAEQTISNYNPVNQVKIVTPESHSMVEDEAEDEEDDDNDGLIPPFMKG